jgi:hypothetical protein
MLTMLIALTAGARCIPLAARGSLANPPGSHESGHADQGLKSLSCAGSSCWHGRQSRRPCTSGNLAYLCVLSPLAGQGVAPCCP